MFPKKTLLSVAGVLAATLLVSACSSGGDTAGTAAAPGAPGAGSNQSAPPATVTIEPANADNISPTTPIVVKAANGKLLDVTVTSAKGKAVAGKVATDGLSWTNTDVLGYGGTYKIVAHAQSTDGKSIEKDGQVTTLSPTKQANANLIPAPSAVKSSGVGVGQPIVFSFGVAVKDKAAVEKALNVESSPKQEGSWYWMDDKNVHYRPKVYWQPGTTLTVTAKIYGVDFGNGVFGAEDRTETYKVHDSWIAKADGNSEQMQIFHNGSMVKSMPISMGKDATPTHLGAHVISDKQANYTMDSCTYGVCPPDPKAYRSDEKFSQRISNDGEFVHENPNSVGQQGSSNVSHGCINLNAANAEWFFQNFGLGDVVEVTNSGGPQLPVWDLYGDWSKSWTDWQKGSAL
ncbi:L,D-transpeptidase [Amycolatopsis saalfeldensis]|uniref:Lipoprotein-anchoring transpeptidase ErfK/SrfK n=1 Tax=Amycolatopsis saalfeldensis TaxID=394193 RepID=A0A1H8YR53_9PSEU|nr:Ig-like domain-containing protein [Amycolatopsis saalfeldensis]SEP54573.1 Lipoprotein-anchoring transpeptidase ErfK/SrfK [Amycolatopsis saalfeldensis]